MNLKNHIRAAWTNGWDVEFAAAHSDLIEMNSRIADWDERIAIYTTSRNKLIKERDAAIARREVARKHLCGGGS